MGNVFDQRKAVLFDIDGTLVDSNEYHVAAWVEAFRRYGIPVPAEAIRPQIGKGGDKLVPSVDSQIDPQAVKELSSLHDEVFRARYLARVQPFADAAELIRRVHEAGLKIVLASSAKQAEIDHYIGLLGVESLIDGSTSADDVQQSKPARDIFAAALEKLALRSPKEAVVVGDTPYDIEAARKCELDTIAVLSGGFDEGTLSGAIAIYPSVTELLATFK